MKLVIFHHHLNPGGVTRVVENHLRSLGENSAEERPTAVLLVHGGRAQDWNQQELEASLPFQLDIATVEGLDYDLTGAEASQALGSRIEKLLTDKGFTADETLLHWHNHSLGKNASVPLAISYLAQAGYRLLLQVHDFAEDFRPGNYRYLVRKLGKDDAKQLPKLLYPQSSNIHYATLNGRDRGVLSEAGVDESRLHFLPNPVARPPLHDHREEARELVNQKLAIPEENRLITYPVRGIRRKNLGETLLWAALCDQASFLVTLAPQNPKERSSFDRWASLSAELNLPCTLGVSSSAEIPFGHLLAASDYLLTTSVAEGFGMTFLECWLVGKELLGRNLPEITSDFKDVGLDLSQLYDALQVPTAWLDRGQFLSEMSSLLAETYSGFGVAPFTPQELQTQLAAMFDAETIDFALLPSSLQESVIRRAATEASSRERLQKLNSQVAIPEDTDSERVATNAAATAGEFSIEKLGQQLYSTYEAVLSSPTTAAVSGLSKGDSILTAFLQTERMNAVRVES
ncbi:MAG: hypothetical protein RH917_10980 [Lacipirellulaceae bacterium]